MKWIEKAVTAFVGPYGSGKTEVSINYALQRRRTEKTVAIVDLDVVTPYFRTREVRAELEGLGLRVVAPGGPISISDLPIVPAEARGVMEDESTVVVVDVGGDPAGSRAFGSLAGRVPGGRLNVLFVVNTNRPFTRTVDSILAYVREIEAAVGRACTGLVSNTHLGPYTTMDMVREGRSVSTEAAGRLGVPVAFTCVPASLAKAGDPGVLPLRFFMRMPWSNENA
ncbi:MAG: hypothetical protein ACM3X4_09310 [Ignavibacteriales bacterium]